jgi:hypothetical protein
MSQKPLPWYAAYNQPPRSPKHGRNWKPAAPSHRDPADGANNNASVRTKLPAAQWTIYSTRFIPIGFAPISYDDPQPPSIPHAGIRAGELTGHRLWWVTDAMELCSLTHLFIWQPGATIEGKVDEPIENNLGFFMKSIYGGVYCFQYVEDLNKEIGCCGNSTEYPCRLALDSSAMFDPGAYTPILGFVWGTIKLWGEVVEHERGYRAQFAKLTSLDGFYGALDFDALKRKYLP